MHILDHLLDSYDFVNAQHHAYREQIRDYFQIPVTLRFVGVIDRRGENYRALKMDKRAGKRVEIEFADQRYGTSMAPWLVDSVKAYIVETSAGRELLIVTASNNVTGQRRSSLRETV